MNSNPSTFSVETFSFDKTIEVPSSKSYANRVLILAALAKEPVRIKNLPLSSDVITMMKCLSQVGLIIEKDEDGIIVKNSFPECEKEVDLKLETGDGGTTNRFLIPLLARGSKSYEIIPEGHMRDRPMEALFHALRELGVDVDFNSATSWLKLQGPIDQTVQKVGIDCSQTTQFLTGLSLALIDTEILVEPENLTVSLPYWELTKDLIGKFKIPITEFTNPVDFSSLSYPLALAAVTGKCLVTNCVEIDKNQADSKFIEILEQMGVTIQINKNGLTCERNKLRAIDFDGSQCPDVIPTLLYVCSFAEGVSTISNLEVLTHKECDRFAEMIKILEAFSINYEANLKDYSITITGAPAKKIKTTYLPPADHRMVMVTYLFMRTTGGGEILGNAHHVAKSFANFYEVMT